MNKALDLAQELLFTVINKDIQRCIELADEIKALMDTYKRSC